MQRNGSVQQFSDIAENDQAAFAFVNNLIAQQENETELSRILESQSDDSLALLSAYFVNFKSIDPNSSILCDEYITRIQTVCEAREAKEKKHINDLIDAAIENPDTLQNHSGEMLQAMLQVMLATHESQQKAGDLIEAILDLQNPQDINPAAAAVPPPAFVQPPQPVIKKEEFPNSENLARATNDRGLLQKQFISLNREEKLSFIGRFYKFDDLANIEHILKTQSKESIQALHSILLAQPSADPAMLDALSNAFTIDHNNQRTVLHCLSIYTNSEIRPETPPPYTHTTHSLFSAYAHASAATPTDAAQSSPVPSAPSLSNSAYYPNPAPYSNLVPQILQSTDGTYWTLTHAPDGTQHLTPYLAPAYEDNPPAYEEKNTAINTHSNKPIIKELDPNVNYDAILKQKSPTAFEDRLECAINLTFMEEPVIFPNGRSYDKTCIAQAIAINPKDPQDRTELKMEQAFPNHTLAEIINLYSKNPDDFFNILCSDQKNIDLFRCPLSKELFIDPVVAADGKTYERKWIEMYLQIHNKLPTQNNSTPSKALYQNRQIKELLEHRELRKILNKNVESYPHAHNREIKNHIKEIDGCIYHLLNQKTQPRGFLNIFGKSNLQWQALETATTLLQIARGEIQIKDPQRFMTTNKTALQHGNLTEIAKNLFATLVVLAKPQTTHIKRNGL